MKMLAVCIHQKYNTKAGPYSHGPVGFKFSRAAFTLTLVILNFPLPLCYPIQFFLTTSCYFCLSTHTHARMHAHTHTHTQDKGQVYRKVMTPSRCFSGMRAPLRTTGQRARATMAQLGQARAPRGAADGSTTGCGHQNIPPGANGAEPRRHVFFSLFVLPSLRQVPTCTAGWTETMGVSALSKDTMQVAFFFFFVPGRGLNL